MGRVEVVTMRMVVGMMVMDMVAMTGMSTIMYMLWMVVGMRMRIKMVLRMRSMVVVVIVMMMIWWRVGG